MLFFLDYLPLCRKSVSLHCVFHSIRFKVNKGWSTAVLLFLCLYLKKKNKYYNSLMILANGMKGKLLLV
ncbi:hypothetical protein E5981_16975 [Bacteroides faecichinchillae]|nr:hypothetical protein E5981_16975 [Bacteroides faecichinchillae]